VGSELSAIFTVLHVYEVSMGRWGFKPMAWVAVPKPAAELEPDKPDEATDDQGNVVTHWKTKNGVRFARVVEPSGFVLWLQEVK
jgi:hypothetical protein